MDALARLNLTQSALTAVLRLARTDGPAAGAALALVRADRTRRAADLVTMRATEARRTYYALDGRVIDTESARWRTTTHAACAVGEERRRAAAVVEQDHPELVRAVARALTRYERAHEEAECPF
jgi:hypothetical protein